jgi:hypothetical protein
LGSFERGLGDFANAAIATGALRQIVWSSMNDPVDRLKESITRGHRAELTVLETNSNQVMCAPWLASNSLAVALAEIPLNRK